MSSVFTFPFIRNNSLFLSQVFPKDALIAFKGNFYAFIGSFKNSIKFSKIKYNYKTDISICSCSKYYLNGSNGGCNSGAAFN